MKVRTALVSVHDKEGVLDLVRGLRQFGIEILSTGGTAAHLSGNGIPVIQIGEYTGFPEVMDGRVKTLHPKIFGGILAVRDNPTHMSEAEKQGIRPIDLVVVNLYPFAQTIAKKDCTFEQAIENIDIGGVALIRAAAKNWKYVAVVMDPADYAFVLNDLKSNDGHTSDACRRELAVKAFRLTAQYDHLISRYLDRRVDFPKELWLTLEKVSDLRYGENPHQKAALYRFPQKTVASVPYAQFKGGKELSYNNILDTDAAFELVREFKKPTCVIIKHTNPCGAASAPKLEEAFTRALRCDPKSAFGGIVAFNGRVTESLAKLIATRENFFEVIIAPEYDETAIGVLKGSTKWGANLRILEAGVITEPRGQGLMLRGIRDGVLAQTFDDADLEKFEIVSGVLRENEETDLRFAWRVCKHVKSNAIVLARGEETVGIGQGQTSRVDSCEIAVRKAGAKARGAVAASDAFFPFPDGVEVLAAAGVVAVIQPGGSIRDAEVLDTAKKRGVKMVFTGMRHFRH